MYHIELRQFPHNACRFNLDARQLEAVLALWVRNEVVDFGERKWLPQLAKLTVLEGPHLESTQLSMGRGWRSAQRLSQDVTQQVLGALTRAGGEPEATPAAGEKTVVHQSGQGHGDIVSLLGRDAPALLEAWQAVIARSSGLAPSESLALAERAVAAPPAKHN